MPGIFINRSNSKLKMNVNKGTQVKKENQITE